jgi:glutaredoxin
LLTTGDYTNFNVDIPEPTYFNGRSASSTNYLRSISRSRSRQPESKRHSQLTEKNDADPEELISEGALVTDDPYSSINHLDTMMEEVLGKSDKEKPSKSEEKKEKREEAGDKEVEGKEKGEDKEVEGKEKKVETAEKEETADKEETAEKEETTTKEETATKEEKDDTKSTEVETVKVEPGKVESAGNVASDEAVPTEDQLKKASDVISEHANQDDVKVEVPDQKEQQPGEEIKKKGESQEAEPEKKTLITDYSEPINQDSVPEDKEPVAAKNDDVVGETMVTNKEKAEPETKPASKDEDEDFDVSPEELRKHLESQPVYIFTSYAGGMQIMHRTNRLATILKGNGIEFTQRDLGTDEEAKKIWRRYSGGKSLPGVVRGDDFIGNWEDIDEANEEYQVRVLVYETM